MMKIILKTELKVDEIYSQLNSITEKFHSDSGNKFLFEGKITNSGFRILQTFDYGAHNQLRPEIIGFVKEMNNSSSIELEFKLPYNLKLLFLITLTINVGFNIFLFLKPVENFISWKIFSMLMIVTFLIFYLSFRAKIKSSTNLLCKTLHAEILK